MRRILNINAVVAAVAVAVTVVVDVVLTVYNLDVGLVAQQDEIGDRDGSSSRGD